MSEDYFLLAIVYSVFLPLVAHISDFALVIYTVVAIYVAIDLYRSNNKYKTKKQ